MSTVIERYRHTNANIDPMLRTTRELGGTHDVSETLDVLERTGRAIADADIAMTFLAEEVDSDHHIATSANFPRRSIDVLQEISEAVERFSLGEQVFIADAATASESSTRLWPTPARGRCCASP